MKEKIRDFLHAHSVAADRRAVDDDESLLSAGVIDSALMMDLIIFVETTFDVVVDTNELTPDNFDSVNAIMTYVEAKKARCFGGERHYPNGDGP